MAMLIKNDIQSLLKEVSDNYNMVSVTLPKGLGFTKTQLVDYAVKIRWPELESESKKTYHESKVRAYRESMELYLKTYHDHRPASSLMYNHAEAIAAVHFMTFVSKQWNTNLATAVCLFTSQSNLKDLYALYDLGCHL